MQKHIDLLQLEMKTLWERDRYRRVRRHPLVALAVAADSCAVRFGSSLPQDLRAALEAVPVGSDAVEEYRRLIEPHFLVEVKSGPSYVFPQKPIAIGTTGLRMATSEEALIPELMAGRPEAWWEAGEWEDLLAGRMGPWAIGLMGSSVVAICHTPVGSPVAAEAGVWTHPKWRGRGYAVAVTAAWAEVAGRSFETLFYSTSSENAASQGVARRLGLRPIGCIWQLQCRE